MKRRLLAIAVLAVGALLAAPGAASAEPVSSAESAAAAAPAPTRNRVSYLVRTRTGDLDGAGTNANIQVRLHGTRGTSGWLNLDNPFDNFERTFFDNFEFELADLGTITSIELDFDHSGDRADWELSYVAVFAGEELAGWFPYYNWLTKKTTISISNAEL